MTEKDVEALRNYQYPGNVRELQNIVERAVIMNNSGHGDFSIAELFETTTFQKNVNSSENNFDQNIKSYEELRKLERHNILKALKAAGYRIYRAKGAAELLKIKPTTLISKIKAMKIPMRPQD